MYTCLPTPSVVIELDILEKNIRTMIENASKYGLAHRPHVKSHRSSELAKLQLTYGAKGITCAKLGEAEVMAANGINDILIAYPMIGADKLERYSELAKKCTLRSIVNSYEGALGLSEMGRKSGVRYEVLIDIDGGVDRGGIKPGSPALMFARSLDKLDGISIVGLMYYPGRNYAEHNLEGIQRVSYLERDELLVTKQLLEADGFNITILSGGNTVSGKVPWCLEGLTEIRAGNYILNDCAQLYFDRVAVEDCALRVIATVVSIPNQYTAIIDAGTKSLSSDSFPSTGSNYGFVVGRQDLQLFKLNEEHGFIKSKEPHHLRIGDRIAIIPNHACVVTNLVDEVYGFRNTTLERVISIDARGKST